MDAQIKNYPNYFINTSGEVFSLNYNNTDKTKKLKNVLRCGYYCVNLCKNGKAKKHLVHRLVAEAFIPNPENKKTVNHKDGNKLNNSFENLEWNTYSENNLHKHRILKKHIGKTHGMTKYCEEDVINVRNLREKKQTYKGISETLNVNIGFVQQVLQGKTWIHVR